MEMYMKFFVTNNICMNCIQVIYVYMQHEDYIRRGSIEFGSSFRRGKALITNLRCLAEVSPCEKVIRR